MGGFGRTARIVAVVAAVIAAGCTAADDQLSTREPVAVDVEETIDEQIETVTTTTTTSTTTTTVPLLAVTNRKDGDSFVASDGTEYRLGLVDAPERSDPCGPQASTFTYNFLAGGFRAEPYTTDDFGRTVAEIFDADGDSLNVALAASGLGTDRYLEEFRHENPELARRLDEAFASAPTPACAAPPSTTSTVAPVPLVPSTNPPTTSPPATSPPATSPPSNCHSAYTPCVPIKGDGSGNGDANDLDCGQIGHPVQLTGTADPYRLDADSDGLGCEG